MQKLNILVVGSGGREHAVVRALSKSPRAGKIFAAPGNGGIAETAVCIDVKATDIDGMITAAKEHGIDLLFVTPDDPLVLGMVDAANKAGIRAFGPTADAALIEGSKVFSKNLMKKYNIPTAAYEVFSDPAAAREYIFGRGKYPIVIKAEGLALGKGVLIANSRDEADAAVAEIMEAKAFGKSGDQVVVEDFLVGREVTVLAFTDGKTVCPMPSSQDHKRALDNDKGLNTGGMGAYSPSPAYTTEIAAQCMERIFKPTVAALNSEGREFKGVIYFGLMLCADGPYVIEYNARFGDPETQAVLPRLESDFLDIIDAVIDTKLDETEIKWSDNAAACVVLASGGYPVQYKKGYEITGISDADTMPDTFVYHAGTVEKNGGVYTNGGRVLGVTSTAATVLEAVKKAYAAAAKIKFTDMHMRTDIGHDA